MNKSQLPDKPSELIRLAIKDMKSCARSSKFEIEMDECYYEKSLTSGKCSVCLAGSVMAQSLSVPTEDNMRIILPLDFPGEEERLVSLDCFRKGEIRAGLDTFYCTSQIYPTLPPMSLQNKYIQTLWVDGFGRHAAPNRQKFYKTMEAMAVDLEKLGH